MNNVMQGIKTYPDSSCDCYHCTDKVFQNPVGQPSNMSVPNCEFSKSFDCYDRQSFRQDIEPKPINFAPGTQFYEINTQAITSKYSPDFTKVDCQNRNGGCQMTQFASTDPRLISAAHGGQVMTLDRPPLNSTVRLSNVYNENLRGYGQGYNTYSDIEAGDVLYYIDKSIQNPFFNPNYVTSATMKGTMLKDPMGAMKPQYDRYPIRCNNPITSDKTSFDGGLSWIQDSTGFREDLMALQSRKRNQEVWAYRWPASKSNNPVVP